MQSLVNHEELYELLGLESNANIESIKKRYHELAKEYHPDRYHNEDSDMQGIAEKMFFEIKNAYDILIETLLDSSDIKSVPATKVTQPLNDLDYAKRFYISGIQFFKSHDINSALDSFLNAKRIVPDNYEYQRMIIRCLLKKNRRLYEAKDFCLSLIKLEPFNPENSFLMGEVYRIAKLEDAATRYYQKALELGFSEKKINIALQNLQKDLGKNKGKGLFKSFFGKK